MLRTWLSSLKYPVGLWVIWIAAINAFPDPPAVQEARQRQWAQNKRLREELEARRMEQKIEQFERDNAKWLGTEWIDDNNDNQESQDRN